MLVDRGRSLVPQPVTVIGGGLAGSEAAWQLARRGVPVRLHEMRPTRPTPVHRTAGLAELVCSNSLKAVDPATPHGLLKAEMERLGSLIVSCAQRTRVPAGGALAVDREAFSEAVTRALLEQPNVTLVREEVTAIPDGIVVLAAGPMVSDALRDALAQFTGRDYLYFFDAIAPVVEADSIDRSIVFPASRYGKGGGEDYLNCPLTGSEYEGFVAALLAGEKAPLHEVDHTPFFEGCLPIEEMARRGRDTLRFGPMKPVGLVDPRTGERPHAVVQLRQDNLAAEHYSMVGFQTQLRWPEQTRIFRTIPGLGGAEFVRLGQIHRNCYINAPTVLRETLQARSRPTLLLAGQISGVEGYTESAATGLLAGMNAARLAWGQPVRALPPDTMLGALCRYVSSAPAGDYQPTNAAFGLLAPVAGERGKKKDRRAQRAAAALASLDSWLAACGDGVPALP
ncbi:MAG TPA: methylenetetrahydrofolate--tRNA-(uracil(54)-C(5))-methyltransferase (FADH(2)-oxidizing) TrmFO [Candidatus Polarisedimenticolaceae bacterium]|nr:methylenetetrahydrofolate--tRNA-(uracil(54)-C(5))-methyltransferase (FADH(2)-oxidizing) TrmFO [Candidatus Polarisedimenticolaceae bacterium]